MDNNTQSSNICVELWKVWCRIVNDVMPFIRVFGEGFSLS